MRGWECRGGVGRRSLGGIVEGGEGSERNTVKLINTVNRWYYYYCKTNMRIW